MHNPAAGCSLSVFGRGGDFDNLRGSRSRVSGPVFGFFECGPMSFNPLAPVTDYQSMLNRIFWFVTGSALVAVWMSRLNNAALGAWLRQVDFNLELGGDKWLPVPGG